MHLVKLIRTKFSAWADSAYCGYQHAAQLNYYVAHTASGFELGFVPTEALLEFDPLSQEQLSNEC